MPRPCLGLLDLGAALQVVPAALSLSSWLGVLPQPCHRASGCIWDLSPPALLCCRHPQLLALTAAQRQTWS